LLEATANIEFTAVVPYTGVEIYFRLTKAALISSSRNCNCWFRASYYSRRFKESLESRGIAVVVLPVGREVALALAARRGARSRKIKAVGPGITRLH
jgi:hypothetical protein